MDESIKPIKIFLSYAHQDDEYRHELMVMSAKHVKFFLSLSAKNIVSKNSANRSPIFGLVAEVRLLGLLFGAQRNQRNLSNRCFKLNVVG
jgi:hypothetical protein